MLKLTPPKTEAELLSHCYQLSGITFSALATRYHQTLPASLTQAKGLIGQLLEYALGASAGNQPEPDFPNLGIELKTIPIDSNGHPRETTYVCTAPINLKAEIESWEQSRVRKKLTRVLWVPVEADPRIPLADRCIGNAQLWSPDRDTEAILRQDWIELTHMLHLGQTDNLSAKIGRYLHIRPKAAHSRVLNRGINQQGEEILINPKGFYLRTTLTQKILSDCYCKA
jgi:DNA mismatch repair protein MutH